MTSTPAAALREALAVLGAPGSLRLLGGDALLEAVTVLGEVQAVLDAVKLRLAGELEARSAVPGCETPVARTGHSTAAAVLAERWQISASVARQYCTVCEATGPRLSLAGEVLPARFPALAHAVGAALDATVPAAAEDGQAPAPAGGVGWVSVEQAALIVRELGKAAPGCSTHDLQAGERVLVEHAPALTVPELRALAVQVRDRLDQDGIEPREARQRRRRSLTITTTPDGMTRLDWLLDPETAGYVVTAIDAAVTAKLRQVRFRDETGSVAAVTAASVVSVPDTAETAASAVSVPDRADLDSDPVAETRTLSQIRCDAAVEVFRHVAGCQHTWMGGPAPVTVVVRIDLDALQAGLGIGQIDGVASPVSAGTVRRMAADADIIPVVLGGHSEVLDLGRARRLFSKAQRLALAERDGGCAWPSCPHPPSYTEAHHIRWWNAHHGRTDLNNGVLLCSSHHHRVHDDGWNITVRENVPYFTPPAHIDPYRRPRPGGRPRLPTAA